VVQVEVHERDAELTADVLWQAGPTAVSQEDLDGAHVRLTADVTDALDPGALPAAASLQVVEVDEGAYLDAWRAWAAPVRAGARVVLHPAWLPVEGGSAGDVTVLIDPGRTFGSGSHPSTRLVIGALEEHLQPGQRVLDVGTGSGVLAVVACLLGASAAVAIDVDAAACAVTGANASRNDVADKIEASDRPLAEITGTFDVVLANIGAAVLHDLAEDLAAHVAPSGILVLSGLLLSQVEAVVSCYPTVREEARLSEGGWVATVLRSPG
jgi:ribosomal protein L11 methyltransferase